VHDHGEDIVQNLRLTGRQAKAAAGRRRGGDGAARAGCELVWRQKRDRH
jgi:hypothetical protein